MNVLINGGSGIFGRKTALHLLEDPDISTVISMDLTPPVDWFFQAIDRYRERKWTTGNDAGFSTDTAWPESKRSSIIPYYQWRRRY